MTDDEGRFVPGRIVSRGGLGQIRGRQGDALPGHRLVGAGAKDVQE
ncbi:MULTISPECIES: hypothetical protein [unclassified Thiocapsa]